MRAGRKFRNHLRGATNHNILISNTEVSQLTQTAVPKKIYVQSNTHVFNFNSKPPPPPLAAPGMVIEGLGNAVKGGRRGEAAAGLAIPVPGLESNDASGPALRPGGSRPQPGPCSPAIPAGIYLHAAGADLVTTLKAALFWTRLRVTVATCVRSSDGPR